ncbi:hypothetical protein VNO77_43800 [Canavalia gladiata]|uniref:Uncharacterized protein n=1 Tax=Canavalia gladiata TaxID=3824 RepID=A0AAN9JVH0_CANGL
MMVQSIIRNRPTSIPSPCSSWSGFIPLWKLPEYSLLSRINNLVVSGTSLCGYPWLSFEGPKKMAISINPIMNFSSTVCASCSSTFELLFPWIIHDFLRLDVCLWFPSELLMKAIVPVYCFMSNFLAGGALVDCSTMKSADRFIIGNTEVVLISGLVIFWFREKLEMKYQDASRYSVGASLPKATQFTPFLAMSRSRMLVKEKRFGHCFSVADSDQLAADNSSKDFGNAENSPAKDRLASMSPPDENFQLQAEVNTESGSQASDDSKSNGSISQKQGSATSQLQAKVNAESGSQTSEDTKSNGSINQKQDSAASPNSQSAIKRPSLTARERLKAARVLSRYTQSKPSKPDMGSRVLEALKESDKGKKKSGLPEAPTNLFDDSKRGLSKGFTFQFPGGSDLFIIVFSFVFISTVMFATTYIVWKLGAIHFNEY